MVIRQSTMDCDEMRKKISEFLGEKIITQTAFLKALGNVSANTLIHFPPALKHKQNGPSQPCVPHKLHTTISDQHAGTWRDTELDGSSPSVVTDTGDPKKRKAALSLRKDHYQVIQQV
ncbi:hypothetical protein L914_01937 [Phytophthora nicotianae]|uniref:DUF7726 domain-containing protein n=1 Tax=Phytophthora nicotianae TaxID=4792 RepID=W2P275_PHYNI|nr:hypothetical protein L914_01937 [Phytophthora nicotianae]